MIAAALSVLCTTVVGTGQQNVQPAATSPVLRQADALHKKGDWDSLKAALPLYVRAAAEAPTDYEAQWKAARIHRMLGDKAKQRVEQDWQDYCAKMGKLGMGYAAKAIELEPSRAPAYMWYAASVGTYADGVSVLRALYEGLKDKTQHALEKAYAIDKTYEDAGPVLGLGRFWSALPWPMRDNKKALALLREFQRYYPDKAEGQVYLAEVLIRKGGNEAEAEAKRLLSQAARSDIPYFRNWAKRLLDDM